MRKEVDLLGELEIDDSKYYGIHTVRAMENFQISKMKISDYPFFVKGMIVTKKACAMANEEMGVLEKEKTQMIISACDEILGNLKKYARFFPTDVIQGGAGTSVNMNTNEVIANVALEMNGHPKGSYEILHPNDHVNRSQSTNDAYPSGLRVALFFKMNQLLEKMKYLTSSIDRKAAQFQSVLKMGRTQLQDAVPMSLGDEFSGWATNLREEIRNLKKSRDHVLELNLGATAIGTGVNAPKGFSEIAIGYLSELTQANFVKAENLIEATSDCGAYVMISGALKRTSVKLSKICNDLRLLSSGPKCGLNEINLPRLQAGSSIMPAKVNPVIPEVVNQVCFKVIGNDVTISFAAEGGQLQLNVMEPVIAHSLFSSIGLLSNSCVTLADKCMNGITANEEHTKEMVLNSVGIITYLTPYIGHHMGDVIGREAVATGKSVREIVREKNLLTEEELNKIFDPENLMRPKYHSKKRWG